MTATLTDAAASVDADLARLVDTLGSITDADLHRAGVGGGWTVAQVVAAHHRLHVGVAGQPASPRCRSRARFFFREEVGHDALGYAPPSVENALARLAAHPPHPRDLPARHDARAARAAPSRSPTWAR